MRGGEKRSRLRKKGEVDIVKMKEMVDGKGTIIRKRMVEVRILIWVLISKVGVGFWPSEKLILISASSKIGIRG